MDSAVPEATSLSDKKLARARRTLPGRLSVLVLALGVLGSTAAAMLATHAARAAVAQSWSPFVLISGLLLVGWVAAGDGVFEQTGALIARLPGGTLAFFTAMMGLVALVTVVLNLDTSIVFLTPVLINAARRRGVEDAPFLYGCVFMSNSASLLLPGSNLTNLLVLSREHLAGLAFAARMAPAWGAAVLVTAIVVGVTYRNDLRDRSSEFDRPATLRMGLGVAGTAVAAATVLLLRDPAPAVLAIGVTLVLMRSLAGRTRLRDVVTSNDWMLFAGLFGIVVALGTLARVWLGPSIVLGSSDRWATAALASVASVAINNLPAAVLLASYPAVHPLALLVGLDLGPNLAITGSLAALLWLQVGRESGARPRASTYSKVGLVLVPLTIGAAMGALILLG